MFSVQVARVQPLVPDVTLFFPSSTAISQAEPLREVPLPQPQPAQRKPLAPINSNREGTVGGQRPPSPGKCKQLDATADFSFSSDTQVRDQSHMISAGKSRQTLILIRLISWVTLTMTRNLQTSVTITNVAVLHL